MADADPFIDEPEGYRLLAAYHDYIVQTNNTLLDQWGIEHNDQGLVRQSQAQYYSYNDNGIVYRNNKPRPPPLDSSIDSGFEEPKPKRPKTDPGGDSAPPVLPDTLPEVPEDVFRATLGEDVTDEFRSDYNQHTLPLVIDFVHALRLFTNDNTPEDVQATAHERADQIWSQNQNNPLFFQTIYNGIRNLQIRQQREDGPDWQPLLDFLLTLPNDPNQPRHEFQIQIHDKLATASAFTRAQINTLQNTPNSQKHNMTETATFTRTFHHVFKTLATPLGNTIPTGKVRFINSPQQSNEEGWVSMVQGSWALDWDVLPMSNLRAFLSRNDFEKYLLRASKFRVLNMNVTLDNFMAIEDELIGDRESFSQSPQAYFEYYIDHARIYPEVSGILGPDYWPNNNYAQARPEQASEYLLPRINYVTHHKKAWLNNYFNLGDGPQDNITEEIETFISPYNLPQHLRPQLGRTGTVINFDWENKSKLWNLLGSTNYYQKHVSSGTLYDDENNPIANPVYLSTHSSNSSTTTLRGKKQQASSARWHKEINNTRASYTVHTEGQTNTVHNSEGRIMNTDQVFELQNRPPPRFTTSPTRTSLRQQRHTNRLGIPSNIYNNT